MLSPDIPTRHEALFQSDHHLSQTLNASLTERWLPVFKEDMTGLALLFNDMQKSLFARISRDLGLDGATSSSRAEQYTWTVLLQFGFLELYTVLVCLYCVFRCIRRCSTFYYKVRRGSTVPQWNHACVEQASDEPEWEAPLGGHARLQQSYVTPQGELVVGTVRKLIDKHIVRRPQENSDSRGLLFKH